MGFLSNLMSKVDRSISYTRDAFALADLARKSEKYVEIKKEEYVDFKEGTDSVQLLLRGYEGFSQLENEVSVFERDLKTSDESLDEDYAGQVDSRLEELTDSVEQRRRLNFTRCLNQSIREYNSSLESLSEADRKRYAITINGYVDKLVALDKTFNDNNLIVGARAKVKEIYSSLEDTPALSATHSSAPVSSVPTKGGYSRLGDLHAVSIPQSLPRLSSTSASSLAHRPPVEAKPKPKRGIFKLVNALRLW